MNEAQGFLKCSCRICTQHIEYPAEGVGQTVQCPTCGKDIVLPSGPEAPPPPMPLPKKASRPTELATKRQKERLLSFGCSFDESITKDEASEMIGRCYSSRPPTTEQLETLKRMEVLDELPENPSMGDARELLRDLAGTPATKEQVKSLTDAGFKVVRSDAVTVEALDNWIKLADAPPQAEDLELLRNYRLKFSGDGFATAVLAALIGQILDMYTRCDEWADNDGSDDAQRVARACMIAMRDPEYARITFRADELDLGVTPTWPKLKLRQWWREARQ